MKITLRKIIIPLVIILILIAIYAYAILSSPLPTSIIDRDASGFISPIEALDAHDLGQRSPSNSASGCIEYYWLKDGMPAYEKCAKNE